MGVILSFSGRSQSGKNTCCNTAAGWVLSGFGLVHDWIINPKDGSLWVKDIAGDTKEAGVLDLMNDHPKAQAFLYEHVYPNVKIYALADLLKDIAVDVFGLDRKLVYGTDADKNTLTDFKWENLPGVITEVLPDFDDDESIEITGRLGPYYKKLKNGMIYHKPGRLTIREFLQYFGTDVCRKIYDKVWINALLRRIIAEDPILALVCDVRFPDEVEGIQSVGGKVVRLTINQDVPSEHRSETSLDRINYDWNNFDYILENHKMNFLEQGLAVMSLLKELGVVQDEATK